jgi:thiamine biosynthesis lipoprotein
MTDTPHMATARAFHFDTLNTVVAQADQELIEEALELCSFYEKLLSRFIEGSDVWRLNHAQGHPVELHPATLQVLQCAERVRGASQGAFNIAIGSASELWDFGSTAPRVPNAVELARMAETLHDFRVTSTGLFATIPATLQIDLGGIAKGFICDRIAGALRERGVNSALLNFGGNVVTVGEHPEKRPWQVGIQTPGHRRESNIFALLECADTAVVTSGIYERGFTAGGELYHHILDPRTCWPARTDLLSVSVILPNSMLADALATAILVLGVKDGLPLAQQFGAKVVLLEEDGQLTCSEGLSLKILGNAGIDQVTASLIETPSQDVQMTKGDKMEPSLLSPFVNREMR